MAEHDPRPPDGLQSPAENVSNPPSAINPLDLAPAAAPAVRWLVDELERLRGELDRTTPLVAAARRWRAAWTPDRTALHADNADLALIAVVDQAAESHPPASGEATDG